MEGNVSNVFKRLAVLWKDGRQILHLSVREMKAVILLRELPSFPFHPSILLIS